MTSDQTSNVTVVPGPPAYERYFVPAIGRPMAEDLIAAAQLRPGEQVLAVACGAGIVARLAARQVMPSGRVAGADINPGMIAKAKRAGETDANIDWQQADAAALPFPEDSFDVVLCQMEIQFFPARLAPLKEMRRVLRPGGRVLVNTPGPKPALFSVIRDGVARYAGPKPAGFLDAVFSLHDPDEYTALLRSAGFHHVDVRRAEKTLDLPPPADVLWQYLQSTSIGADVFNNTDTAARAALEADVRKGCQQFETESGMKLQVGLTTATAQQSLCGTQFRDGKHPARQCRPPIGDILGNTRTFTAPKTSLARKSGRYGTVPCACSRWLALMPVCAPAWLQIAAVPRCAWCRDLRCT